MSARANTTTPIRPLTTVGRIRAFRITVVNGNNDSYGLVLEETYGRTGNALAAPVATTTPAQTGRITDAVFAAARSSGHSPSVFAFTRNAPIQLDEVDGVRLALILLTTQPITKHSRVRAIVAGINAMSVEETYYWYSKCIGMESSRARKALRTLLADD